MPTSLHSPPEMQSPPGSLDRSARTASSPKLGLEPVPSITQMKGNGSGGGSEKKNDERRRSTWDSQRFHSKSAILPAPRPCRSAPSTPKIIGAHYPSWRATDLINRYSGTLLMLSSVPLLACLSFLSKDAIGGVGMLERSSACKDTWCVAQSGTLAPSGVGEMVGKVLRHGHFKCNNGNSFEKRR